ncbi:hypothetical protein [Rothia aerolata]|uniref:Uncharacterized protein n=1 Tax=Rothia aerolata TaxID=1812262 RepID=A0A917IWM4_9MICC|nr:hypothetical protein [Rothia aerolata]GGH63820.1 hypothetical protein GCM10007359_15500 [Rothia aerolata]
MSENQQAIPSELEQQIQMVTNHAINSVVEKAQGKDKKQIFEELKTALNKVGVQPADESVRKLARQIWRDLNPDKLKK